MDTKLKDLLNITGFCPILVSAGCDEAAPIAKALAAGGAPSLEILMRDDNSLDNLKIIARDVPEVIVGAGTIINKKQAEIAIDAGAKFIILPGFSREVVEFCLKKDVPVIPGCVTPTEVMAAVEYGLDVVKFFPVYEMGGVATLAHLNGPFPKVRFLNCGGLSSTSFLPLIKYKGTLACGGDWMFTDHNAQADRNYEQIAENVRHSVYNVLDIRAGKEVK